MAVLVTKEYSVPILVLLWVCQTVAMLVIVSGGRVIVDAGTVTVGPSSVVVDPVSVTITVEVAMMGPPGNVGQLRLGLTVTVSTAGHVALMVTVVGAQELLVVLVVLVVVKLVPSELVVVLSVV